ncbi:MAG: OmpA family protein [Syntrophobacterales bacterium]|nr:OmpA family protein [Syntrophobacterales bacterium]
MHRKRHDVTSPSGKNPWLITYADLFTLLLTFFVLIFSMAVIDVEREKEVLNSLIGAFKFLPEGRSLVGDREPENIPKPSIPMDKPLSITEGYLKQLAASGLFGSEVDILRKEDRVMVRVTDSLFDEGSSKLLPSGERFLSTLGSYLKNDPQQIEIRGHTDRFEVLASPDSEAFSWKLSTERALTVYRLFISLGIEPQRMSAHGMSFFHPIVDGSQYPSFRHKNRRVEILLGDNPSIPANLYSLRSERRAIFQYKHFFFPLFEKESENEKRKTER